MAKRTVRKTLCTHRPNLNHLQKKEEKEDKWHKNSYPKDKEVYFSVRNSVQDPNSTLHEGNLVTSGGISSAIVFCEVMGIPGP